MDTVPIWSPLEAALERAAVRNQRRPLGLEHRKDRAGRVIRVGLPAGRGHALVEEPRIELGVAGEPQPRREPPLADRPDLVLDLPLLPARAGRTGHRLNQVVTAQLREAAVELPDLADEHGVDRRLHVVVDAAPTGAAKERERTGVGVEHHLLGLARIRTDERHPAVAQPHVRDLDRCGHAGEHHDLVRPVELVSFARLERQRHVGRLPLALGPSPLLGVAAHGIVAACIPCVTEQVPHPHQRQPLPPRLTEAGRQQRLELRLEGAQLRVDRRCLPIVAKRCLVAPEHLPDRIPRDATRPGNRLDALPVT